MPGLMRASDVLVAPFKDSYGPSDYFMVVLEAMATGRPVVVSRVGGMPEVVDPAWGRLVDPHDSAAIAGSLLEYVLGEDLGREAGKAARRYCEATFDPSMVAAAYRSLYEEASA
jgi:glycosyltransferase involved in cell wall biosynthesis